MRAGSARTPLLRRARGGRGGVSPLVPRASGGPGGEGGGVSPLRRGRQPPGDVNTGGEARRSPVPGRLRADAERRGQLHFVVLHGRESFVRGRRCDFSKCWLKIGVDGAHACVGNRMLVYVLGIKIAGLFPPG